MCGQYRKEGHDAYVNWKERKVMVRRAGATSGSVSNVQVDDSVANRSGMGSQTK